MSLQRAFGILLAVLCLAVPLPAQFGDDFGREISGFVRSARSNQPVDGTLIILSSDAGEVIQQIVPEGSGHFRFTNLRKQVFYVTVRAPGYRESTQRANLIDQRQVSLYFFLTPDIRPGEGKNVPPEGTVDQRELATPEKALKEFEKGRKLLMDEKEPAKSLRFFQKAIEIHPAYTQAYFYLGTAYMDLSKMKEAQAAFEKTVELNEKLALGHLALGTCLSAQGDAAAAEKPLVRAVELSPESPEGRYELGRVYWALDRWQDAEPHARKAVELRPGHGPAHLLMGNILLRKRSGREALAEFREYLRLEPQGPLAVQTREMVAQLEKALGPGSRN
jgi:tetratricopeptide (TPR) repeat protein